MSHWDDDFMELGETGWIPSADGWYFNKYTKHVMDDIGREYDEQGKLIHDPTELN